MYIDLLDKKDFDFFFNADTQEMPSDDEMARKIVFSKKYGHSAEFIIRDYSCVGKSTEIPLIRSSKPLQNEKVIKENLSVAFQGYMMMVGGDEYAEDLENHLRDELETTLNNKMSAAKEKAEEYSGLLREQI